MKCFRSLLGSSALLIGIGFCHCADATVKNLVLVTVDGLRWQEIFRGPDARLVASEEFTEWREVITERFGESATTGEPQFSAQKLMPFLTGEIASRGILYGNRDRGECFQVTNPWYFSYPGYSEILTGFADPSINSNAKKPNPNVTFLEYLNGQKGFINRIQAFASWDVFPYIINNERNGIPVNAGFMPTTGRLTQYERWLNEMQKQTPSPWSSVRLDVFTHHYALEALRNDKPRVLYIAYGETDDFAHDGEYDQYLLAANRTDRFIAELWQTIQTIRFYRDKTLLLITTDHGRGELPLETWQHHASMKSLAGYMKHLAQFKQGIVGSENTWFAALGTSVDGSGFSVEQEACYGAHQIAATALQALGNAWRDFNPAIGAPLPLAEP